jgi:hypothetical protein
VSIAEHHVGVELADTVARAADRVKLSRRSSLR